MWILDNISRARGFKEPAVPINNPLNFMDHCITVYFVSIKGDMLKII